jgi:hypothetical protein
MKMKKILLFMLNLLAVASLGLALPPKAKTTTHTGITTDHSAPTFPPKATGITTVNPATPTLPASPTPVAVPASVPASPDELGQVLSKVGGGGVSPKCATAIFSLLTDPEILKCIPIQAFIPLIPIITDPSLLPKFLADPAGTFKKIEPPFIAFSKIFCAAPKCSDKLVQKAIKTFSDGCGAELKDNALIKAAFSLIVFYSPLHDTICFKTKKGDEFCWDDTLKTVFSLPKSPIKIVDGGLIDAVAVADPEAVCTRCNKDIVNTFFNFLKPSNKLALQILAELGITDKALEQLKVFVAVKCGIKFEDGKVPDKPGK